MSASQYRPTTYRDEPPCEPLEQAAVHAARKYGRGEPMTEYDWAALNQKSTVELREYDLKTRPF